MFLMHNIFNILVLFDLQELVARAGKTSKDDWTLKKGAGLLWPSGYVLAGVMAQLSMTLSAAEVRIRTDRCATCSSRL